MFWCTAEGDRNTSFAGFSFTGSKENNDHNNNCKLGFCLQSVWVFIKDTFAHKKHAAEPGSILSKVLINLDNRGRGFFVVVMLFLFLIIQASPTPLCRHQCFTRSAPGWQSLPSSYKDNKIHCTATNLHLWRIAFELLRPPNGEIWPAATQADILFASVILIRCISWKLLVRDIFYLFI